ncbi:hypothetical protein AAFF_G00110960 [Aldrovandia affinis]|uniref:Uncharacterized protein n=1 Tax=Aldrovandia affinis TaxID=143900 RepID=A0AAD7RTR4_9TELE|nr:hypothetical protein AAFF_G00110960 [Aldrovandia affinis]
MIKVHHLQELLENLGCEGCGKSDMAATSDGRGVAPSLVMWCPKEVNGRQAKLALRWVHYEAVLAEAFEVGPQVGQVFRLAFASDE